MEQNQTNDKKTKEGEDTLTNFIGELGKWQYFMLLTLLAPTKITSSWYNLGIVFIAPATTFKCVATNLTDNPEVSQCYSDCENYEYESDFGNTIISEWGLICDKAWMSDFTQTVSMLGVLVGSIIFGFFADRYGRRPALLTSCGLQLCAATVQGFCPTYWLFTAVRFFLGMSTAGTLLCTFIFIMEITGPRKREFVGCLCAVPLAIGQMLMPVFSYFLRSYDMFSLGVAVPSVLYLSYYFIMPESPKWLISMGRLEEASEIMKKAAQWNNLPAENMLAVAKSIATENELSSEANKIKATYMDLLKTKALRINTVCICTVWFMVGLTFYGSNQYIGQTSSNAFISVFLAGAVQIPGIILVLAFCKYIGRRLTLIGFFVVCALCNGLLAIPNYYVRLIMGPVGVGCSSGAFSAVYMFTAELFPTTTRNMAMGASSTVSRVGSMLAPFMAGLNSVAPWLPPAIFAIVPLIAAIACYCLPETRGQKLPDRVA